MLPAPLLPECQHLLVVRILNVNNEICDELATWKKQKLLLKTLGKCHISCQINFVFFFSVWYCWLSFTCPSFMSPRNKISGDYSLTVSSKQNITRKKDQIFIQSLYEQLNINKHTHTHTQVLKLTYKSKENDVTLNLCTYPPSLRNEHCRSYRPCLKSPRSLSSPIPSNSATIYDHYNKLHVYQFYSRFASFL